MSSREIKFRVWETSPFGNQMRNVDLFFFEEEDIREVPGDTRNRYEVMQYTGLKDKKGQEIYEGDICTMKDGMVYSFTAHRMVEGRYQVYWNDDRWGLQHGEFKAYDNGDYYHGDEITWRECEVIGNIYETPELIAKEEKP